MWSGGAAEGHLLLLHRPEGVHVLHAVHPSIPYDGGAPPLVDPELAPTASSSLRPASPHGAARRRRRHWLLAASPPPPAPPWPGPTSGRLLPARSHESYSGLAWRRRSGSAQRPLRARVSRPWRRGSACRPGGGARAPTRGGGRRAVREADHPVGADLPDQGAVAPPLGNAHTSSLEDGIGGGASGRKWRRRGWRPLR